MKVKPKLRNNKHNPKISELLKSDTQKVNIEDSKTIIMQTPNFEFLEYLLKQKLFCWEKITK